MRFPRSLHLIAALVVLSIPLAPLTQAASGERPTSIEHTMVEPSKSSPVFAYYYIWYTHSSWRRAKSDRPLLGPYDSNDAKVIRQHIMWAKSAGIDGFIVSWKHTAVLDERLSSLVDIAEREHFSLAIIYQGLDFHRNPLPASEIGAGLTWFDQHFASRAPFKSSGKPLVIWSGTWKFSHDQIASVTSTLRTHLRILGSAKNPKDYLRIADAVDGNAYYWSSVNPETFTGYRTKLQAMAAAVHAHKGTWIAPAAVGFDAKLLGGKTTVARNDGATFRSELAAAKTSSPDLIGLISWNEFSENSHIEPSDRYGTCALNNVATSSGLPAPQPDGCSKEQAAGLVGPINPLRATSSASASSTDLMDSSAPGSGAAYGPYVAGGFVIFLAFAVVITVRRRRKLLVGQVPAP